MSKARMHKTSIDIDGEAREQLVALLNQELADTFDLYSQTKQAHWNVKGPHFIALHELFDSVHAVVVAKVDMLAERLTTLGGTAEGTLQAVGKRSSLPGYPVKMTRGEDHLEAVAAVLAVFGGLTRLAIDICDEAGDKVTADLFNEITGEIVQVGPGAAGGVGESAGASVGRLVGAPRFIWIRRSRSSPA